MMKLLHTILLYKYGQKSRVLIKFPFILWYFCKLKRNLKNIFDDFQTKLTKNWTFTFKKASV